MSRLISSKKRLLPKLTHDFFGGYSLTNPWNKAISSMEMNFFTPAVNIQETEDAFILELAAPGQAKEDFQVEVKNHQLLISSELESENLSENKIYKRKEYSFTSFSRAFYLPENCLQDEIEASYENGTLTVFMPKKEVDSITPQKSIVVS